MTFRSIQEVLGFQNQKKIFLSKLYAQHGAWTHHLKIKSRMLHSLSPGSSFFTSSVLYFRILETSYELLNC